MTVRRVAPVTVPTLALMVLVPTATAVARPAAVMVAVAGVPDVHVAEPVSACVLPSL
jgi:hypothetical protein